MIRIKMLLLAMSLLVGTMSMTAQETEQIKKQIASVKKSSQYLYGEAVAATEEESKSLAEELLYNEINSWAAKQRKLQNKTIAIRNQKELQTMLSLPRGNMFRSFVYVKKSDVISVPDDVAVVPATATNAPAAPAAAYPEVVMTIASYTDYHQMAEKIKELKNAGKIGHYARYANLERPEIYYLVIYNQQGQVMTVLTPGENRTNVKTGQPDKVTNYSGCGAIGFTVK